MAELSAETKKFIETFYNRINTLYTHTNAIKEIVKALEAYKTAKATQLAQKILDEIEMITKQIIPILSTPYSDTVTTTEQALKQEELSKLHDFEQLNKDLDSGGHEAKKKMEEVLKAMEKHLKIVKEKETAVKHIIDAMSLTNGFITEERALLEREKALIDRTRTAITTQQEPSEYDALIYEWQRLSEKLELTLKQEKKQIIDHIEPLFAKKFRPIERAQRVLEWITGKRPRTEEEKEALKSGQLITLENIQKDLKTFTSPGEIQQYQSMLFKYSQLLTPDARTRLERQGLVSGRQAIREEQRLTQLAFVDELTGLHTRRVYLKDINDEIKRAERGHTKTFAILFIDGDNFKQYNDRYDHQIGDRILKFLSEQIRKRLRQEDGAYRFGGEEIIMLLKDADETGAVSVAKELMKQIYLNSIPLMQEINRAYAEKLRARNKEPMLHVTVSIGIATYPQDAKTQVELEKIADHRVIKAKESGKNRAVTKYKIVENIKQEVTTNP